MNIKVLITAISILLSQSLFAANILVVMSDKDSMELKAGKTYKTGFYLSELMEPVREFINAGHTITFATPTGVAPTIDPNSHNLQYFKNDKDYYNLHINLLKSLKITDPMQSPVVSFNRVMQIGIDKYDAFFAPGGHAPMQDLIIDDQLGEILFAFHQSNKPTGLVCHGPIILLSSLTNNDEFVADLKSGKDVSPPQDWIYSNYNMTVFSNSEETIATKYYIDGEMYFFPEDALKKAGGIYSKSKEDWAKNVVTDRELITGQNPASALGVAKEILKRI